MYVFMSSLSFCLESLVAWAHFQYNLQIYRIYREVPHEM